MYRWRISERVFYKIGLLLLWFAVLLVLYSVSDYPKNIRQAIYFRGLASNFPPSSIRYKRFLALSEAFLRGSTNYHFKMPGVLPPITK
jgi:hypothetical protein